MKKDQIKENINMLRRRKHISIEELSKLSMISEARIYRRFDNESEWRLGELEAIGKVLGASAKDLAFGKTLLV